MIIETGNKVHIIYRALFENSRMFMKKPERRTTIVNLAESGYIVNMIPTNVDLNAVEYRYVTNSGLVATDGGEFRLDINEFSMKH